MAWHLPVGFDYADGQTPLPAQPLGAGGAPTIIGTPLPTADLQVWSSYGDALLNQVTIQEDSGSPHIERAEQATCSHNLTLSDSAGLFYISVLSRGTMVTDTYGNVWRILSSDLQRNMAGNTAKLSYVMESISFDSPPDDFDIEEVSLDLNIIKHPRYAWALNPYTTDASTYSLAGDTRIYYTQIKEAIIRMIQNYIDSPFYPSQAQTQGLIQSNILAQLGINSTSTTVSFQVNYPNPNFDASKTVVAPVSWNGVTLSMPTVNCVFFLVPVTVDMTNPNNPIVIALAAAQELISKLWRQEDTPYIAGYRIVWKQKFFAPVYLNPGGYIEDPRYIVPQYFMSPFNNGIVPRGEQGSPFGGDTSSPVPYGYATIFDALPYWNPQCYAINGIRGGALSFSCLRKSDRVHYERTWFEVTHTWDCAPIGKWDSDIYSQYNRPQNANDYNLLPSIFS